jgi:tetratricopeptide (TPR) repeat protein
MGIDPDEKYLDKANELVEEALSLNPRLSKAYFVRSGIQETRGELRETFISIMRAIELDPYDSESLMMISFMYSLVGRPELAKPYAAKAITIDPLNPIAYWGDWWIHTSEGKLDLVLENTTKMYSLDNDNIISAHAYALSLIINNRIKEANEVYDKFINAYLDSQFAQLFQGYRYAINNDYEKASQSITPELIKAAEMDHLWAYMIAQFYSMIGEKDKAVDFLERATRDVFINYPLFAKYDPLLENIRGEDRFKNLMKRVKKEWENFKI